MGETRLPSQASRCLHAELVPAPLSPRLQAEKPPRPEWSAALPAVEVWPGPSAVAVVAAAASPGGLSAGSRAPAGSTGHPSLPRAGPAGVAEPSPKLQLSPPGG